MCTTRRAIIVVAASGDVRALFIWLRPLRREKFDPTRHPQFANRRSGDFGLKVAVLESRESIYPEPRPFISIRDFLSLLLKIAKKCDNQEITRQSQTHR